jgi:hypothetical protein
MLGDSMICCSDHGTTRSHWKRHLDSTLRKVLQAMLPKFVERVKDRKGRLMWGTYLVCRWLILAMINNS